MPEQRFATKRDTWLVAVVLLPLAVVPALMFSGAPTGRGAGGVPVVFLLVAAVVVSMMLRTFYVVADDTLTVWCGPLRYRRAMRDLVQLRSSRSPVSSPAWSLDRIAIGTTRGHWLLVSPADKAGFVRAVKALAPQVALDEPLARLLQDP
jgi:hypothetical protein